MHLFDSIDEIRPVLIEKRKEGKTIGLVPTMGALHDGHLSLVDSARSCDVVVVSIFVNPEQFNNTQDLDRYPRTLEADLQALKGKCDLVFAPESHHIYAHSPLVSIDFGPLSQYMEGKFRPGHFQGVGLIVAKLFNIIQPDYAYFGLKDLQQYLLIKQMVKDLSFPIQIVGCETKREHSGLAMSSRNLNLSAKGRQIAAGIYEGLNIVKKGYEQGEDLKKCKENALNFYSSIEELQIEYLEFTADNLEVVEDFEREGSIAVCVAGYLEGVRLIDNLYLRSQI